ncbi:CIB1 [Acanthosepion pharaonis]|uniref:CIB1 n=1 Tax=Acanthosepion pharaonis TaxID=158019 RepID=A0A812CAC6_ACAPH|nr:CIB1 [Sepia pharaonis]
MGNKQTVFDKDEMDAYEELTFFSRSDILKVYERFKTLAKEKTVDQNIRLDEEEICRLPELKVNPFKDRICKIFSSSNDGSMSFEDFLDMMSVFSDNAPRSLKAEYVFQDLCKDLVEIIQRITTVESSSDKLSDEEMQQLIDNIFEEADLDDDDHLSFQEFEHVLSKAPDFTRSFRFHL